MRLIDAQGKQRGIFSVAEAETTAQAESQDLILITEKAQPPVVKLGDYRKSIYQHKKEQKEKKKPKQEWKEVRISFVEAEGDMLRKAKQISEFLTEGSCVQIRLMLKGRQKLHFEFAREKFVKFLGLVEEPYKFIQAIKKEPNFLWATIGKR